ncbi:MAG TPA: hypothetical protein V6C64_11935 [Microcoleaceae cyanobacterium]|jgi:hypothetical protein
MMKTLMHTATVSLALVMALPVVGTIATVANAAEVTSANCQSSLHPTTMGGTARSDLAAQGKCATTADTALSQSEPAKSAPGSSMARPANSGGSYPAYCQIPMTRIGGSMWLQLEALERCRNGA